MPIELPRDRVTRELRKRVESGEWRPGEQLPSYGTLAEQLGTSKATISIAVERLAAEGMLVVLSNFGTFRAEDPEEPDEPLIRIPWPPPAASRGSLPRAAVRHADSRSLSYGASTSRSLLG